MPIASDACLLRIGTGRPRPNAPRVARSHALCERIPLQQATERRPGGCLSPPPLPTGILTSPAVVRASLASSGSGDHPGAESGGGGDCGGARGCAQSARSRVREGASEARTAHAGGVEHASSTAMGPRARVALASAVCREFHGRSSVC